jgi:hypothetical protein
LSDNSCSEISDAARTALWMYCSSFHSGKKIESFSNHSRRRGPARLPHRDAARDAETASSREPFRPSIDAHAAARSGWF